MVCSALAISSWPWQLQQSDDVLAQGKAAQQELLYYGRWMLFMNMATMTLCKLKVTYPAQSCEETKPPKWTNIFTTSYYCFNRLIWFREVFHYDLFVGSRSDCHRVSPSKDGRLLRLLDVSILCESHCFWELNVLANGYAKAICLSIYVCIYIYTYVYVYIFLLFVDLHIHKYLRYTRFIHSHWEHVDVPIIQNR